MGKAYQRYPGSEHSPGPAAQQVGTDAGKRSLAPAVDPAQAASKASETHAFLPLVPVLAGLLSGRFLGPYVAAIAALALIVLGLVTGQATAGSVTIGSDRDPLMASEDMVFVTENMPLMPPQLYEDAGFVEDLREAVREGNVGNIAAWLYLMVQWWVPTCVVGTVFAFAELVPRLLAAHLVGLGVLWAAVAGAVSWGVWWVKKVTREGFSRRSRQ
jgi:hypothetical protein